jgi:ankyrin repeat protein
MKKLNTLLMILAIATSALLAQEPTIRPEVASLVGGNVFEVVVQKPLSDPCSYAEAPPVDATPFAERNDPYLSIGTAFALGAGRFVSAGHVFSPKLATLLAAYGLRDRRGKVYPIGSIVAFSLARDYIVFEVPGIEAGGLQTAPTPGIGTRVYSVGNAFGEGVVTREGLLTSQTPEEWKGEWKWLRFSAPASPGNSGGPLVDAEGRVLGIVVAKSENENLNYALPIAEVAVDSTARFDERLSYSLPNFSKRIDTEFHVAIPLPLDLGALRSKIVERYAAESQALSARLVAENRSEIFPRASGSAPALGDAHYVAVPSFLGQGADGTWTVATPQKPYSMSTKDGGSLVWGELYGYTVLAFDAGHSRKIESSDPKGLMDALLEGYQVSRTDGGRSTRVTSFGEPLKRDSFRDSWGRRWFSATWGLPLGDSGFSLDYLPTPQGALAFFKQAPFGRIEDYSIDMRALCDFAYISYQGDMAQWVRFLSDKDSLPTAFASWRLTYEPGQYISIRTPRLSLYVDPSSLSVEDQTQLSLAMAYYGEASAFFWDVGALSLSFQGSTKDLFTVVKSVKPWDTASDSIKQFWHQLFNSSYPFNGSPLSSNGSISTYVTLPVPGGTENEEPRFLYWLAGSTTDPARARELETRTQAFKSGLSLRDREVALLKGLSPGADTPGPDLPLIKGKTIYDSIASGDGETLRAFIESKSDLDVDDGKGGSPLVAALLARRSDMIDELLAAGAKVGGIAPDGSTPLMLSMAPEFGALPKRLIGLGADASTRTASGKTAFGEALKNGRDELAASLLPSLDLAKTVEPGGWTPLLLALRYSAADTVVTLLDGGCDRSAVAEGGWGALHLAARFTPKVIPRLLPATSSAVNARKADGGTALALAAQFGDRELVRALLSAGADPSIANAAGWTALMFALRYGKAENVAELMRFPKTLTAVNADGWNALHFAARYCPGSLPEAFEAAKGSSVTLGLEERTRNGYTLLHLAVVSHSCATVRWLIEHGCDRQAKTSEGQTALDIAREQGDFAMQELLATTAQ